MRFLPSLLAVVSAGFLASAAPAATDPPPTAISVALGWDGFVRTMDWTPMFVTLSSAQTRSVRIEAEQDGERSYITHIEQRATIGPTPSTFTLYLHVEANYNTNFLRVVARDEQTGKTLASWPPENSSVRPFRFIDNSTSAIGVSGVSLEDAGLLPYSALPLNLGYLPPHRLPRNSIGYDSLDLLILYRPDLDSIDPEALHAIVEWVRRGGRLLLVPGELPFAVGNPLNEILPARIGGPSEGSITNAGLDAKVSGGAAQKSVRRVSPLLLTPNPSAEPYEVMPATADQAAVVGYRKQAGLGMTYVLPADIFQLRLGSFEAPSATYTKLFRDLLDRDGRFQQYDGQLQHHMAEIPGHHLFDFQWAAWGLAGLFLLVGPVDWLVLKRLGRQPWTWVTTTGWIALATTGAVYAGTYLNSGQTHFRTVTVMTQCDASVIRRETLAALYSPRTRDYAFVATDAEGKRLNEPPAGWWAISPVSAAGQLAGVKSDAMFHQTSEQNAPDSTTVKIWNMQFWEGQDLRPGVPLLRADLRHQGGRIEGTLTNLGDHPLEEIRVLVMHGWLDPAAQAPSTWSIPSESKSELKQHVWRGQLIAPQFMEKLDAHQTAAVTGWTKTAITSASSNIIQLPNREWDLQDSHAARTTSSMALSAFERSTEPVVPLLQTGRYALIIAKVAGMPTPMEPNSDSALEVHETFLQALVPLQGEPIQAAELKVTEENPPRAMPSPGCGACTCQ